ncbi:MAG: DUF3298 and DUF4163 domain-containing protein [Fimbriimonadaceae bacterium]|nr:DUF3298 and DUF4163 domain-containing protein [Fimbriimonadaceae bacterium]QYK54973.1 MAG: DUF3298 and DUF4163 domain-containing protein [Fimbriimonadaceae bacterium]
MKRALLVSAFSGLLSLVALAQPYHTEKLSSVREGAWSVKGEYPQFLVRTVVAGYANAGLKKAAVASFDAFLAQAKKDVPELRKDGITAAYDYEQGFTVHTVNAALVSVSFSTYRYTGGAHGMGQTTTYNYAVGLKPEGRRLRASDLVPKGVDPMKTLGPEIIGKLLQSGKAEWLEDGMLTELTTEQLNRFAIDKKGITWFFDPYEMASYAAGPQEAFLTWEELQPYLNPNGVVRPPSH